MEGFGVVSLLYSSFAAIVPFCSRWFDQFFLNGGVWPNLHPVGLHGYTDVNKHLSFFVFVRI